MRLSLYQPHRIQRDGGPKRSGLSPTEETDMGIASKFNNWRKYRQTINELDRMTDRELHDLGIGRHDIRRVARTAAGI